MSKDPKWYSTKPADRKRKPIEFTLDPEVISWLTAEAERKDIYRSTIVEALIRKEMKRR